MTTIIYEHTSLPSVEVKADAVPEVGETLFLETNDPSNLCVECVVVRRWWVIRRDLSTTCHVEIRKGTR